MASRLPSVLSPSISPKLSALRTRLGRKQSDHELRQILAELSALPANLVVRASREIAKKAGPGWWQPQMLPLRVVAVGPARLAWMRLKKALWLEWPSRSVPSEQELLKRNHDFAWLFLFHPSGYLREAALDRINSPPTSPFFFSALARISHSVEAHRGANQRKLLCSNDFSLIHGAPRCRQSVTQNNMILEWWKAGLWKRPLMAAW
jgi:hypothetical protein